MISIIEPRITLQDGKFVATCKCNKVNIYTTKNCALKMLNNGVCRYCRKQHTAHYLGMPDGVFKTADGKWGSHCSGCNKEQLYTRPDHAKQSELNDWQCKQCIAKAKGYSKNMPVGDKKRVYNKFRKSAYSRGISWNLTELEMYSVYNGVCEMTGWDIDLSYNNSTASLDRIDSNVGYEITNIQWVHKLVNMMKNKYSKKEFVNVCKAVASKN